MHRLPCILLVSWSLIGIDSAFVQAQDLILPAPLCQLPRKPVREPRKSTRPDVYHFLNGDEEPNDEAASAQKLPLGYGAPNDPDVDLLGSIEKPFDQDYFSFEGEEGFVLGVACLDSGEKGKQTNSMNPQIEVFDPAGNRIFFNDDHHGIASKWPAVSPMPEGQHADDSVVVLVLPTAGTFTVLIKSYGAGTGGYFARFRYRRAPMLERKTGQGQVIFLQFNGASFDANKLFGQGARTDAQLSAFRTFLPRWGFQEEDEVELTEAICGEFERELSEFAPDKGNSGRRSIVVRNSLHHKDFKADETVSQIVIGGTYPEFGVNTIGIASCIDPGNFSMNDKAVVLLDKLSGDPKSQSSINSLQVLHPTTGKYVSFAEAPRDLKVKILSNVIARIALHEAGHFLGCFHCQNDNSVSCIMDQGGRLKNFAGAGEDGVLGTEDDNPNGFVADIFAESEMFAEAGTQYIPEMISTALLTGQMAPDAILAQNELENARRKLNEANHRNSLQVGLIERSELLTAGRFVADADGRLDWEPYESIFVDDVQNVNYSDIFGYGIPNKRNGTIGMANGVSFGFPESDQPAWLNFLNRAFGNKQYTPFEDKIAVQPKPQIKWPIGQEPGPIQPDPIVN
jgi:hypothetical protein